MRQTQTVARVAGTAERKDFAAHRVVEQTFLVKLIAASTQHDAITGANIDFLAVALCRNANHFIALADHANSRGFKPYGNVALLDGGLEQIKEAVTARLFSTHAIALDGFRSLKSLEAGVAVDKGVASGLSF